MSHRIVAVVPVGSSSAQATVRPRVGGGGGGGSGARYLSPEEIRQVQIVLKEKGFYDGPSTACSARGCGQALIAFQRAQGFQATGQIDTRRSRRSM